MIQAPPGLKARFKCTKNVPGGTRTYYEYCRVCAFDDDGTPLIVAQEPEHRLVPATRYHNYHGLVDTVNDDYDYIALIPGGGWRCKEELVEENGERWVNDQPLVAWALRRDGAVIPLQTDGDGFVYESEKPYNATRTVIYHPDHTVEENTK